MNNEVEFALMVEAGMLEPQSVLLAESIRSFGGRYCDDAITAVSPRPERRPQVQTIRRLEDLNVEYLELDLQSPVPEYGTSWRVAAMAHVGARSGPSLLVQLDTDTVFCAEPDFDIGRGQAAVRPVDVKGMCSSGPGDPFESCWEAMCAATGSRIDQLPWIISTVDQLRLRASYNGGLIAAHRSAGIFELASEYFDRIIAADIRPFADSGLRVRSGTELVSQIGSETWGTAQAAMSLAMTDLGVTPLILDRGHNIPANAGDQLPFAIAEPKHVHYHHLLDDWDGLMALMAMRALSRLPSAFMSWLGSRAPLNDSHVPTSITDL